MFLESRGRFIVGVYMADKIFQTYNDQLKILISRGLAVQPSDNNIIMFENYYNVVNGYKDLFLDTTAPTETYKKNATFSEIHALYEFDRELRFIFLKRLLIIENRIKSVIAYKFSEKYGHDNYLKLSNFKPYKNDRELQAIMAVISTFQKAIANQSGRHNAVTHYVKNYGYVPLWVLVNVLSFGNISKFYGVLDLPDRQSISKEFGMAENVFKSYLILMSFFRNICAHDERLYNTHLPNVEIVSGSVHARLGIPRNSSGKYQNGTNDVFALLICIREFLQNHHRSELTEALGQIDDELTKLAPKIHTISRSDILDVMGFPANWNTV